MYGLLDGEVEFKTLIGKTLTMVCTDVDEGEIWFHTVDGVTYRLFHEQQCCETVEIEDICGNLEDLIGSPIVQAEEVEGGDAPPEDPPTSYNYDTFTWTFYKIGTVKGQVTIRWYGASNGCYAHNATLQVKV